MPNHNGQLTVFLWPCFSIPPLTGWLATAEWAGRVTHRWVGEGFLWKITVLVSGHPSLQKPWQTQLTNASFHDLLGINDEEGKNIPCIFLAYSFHMNIYTYMCVYIYTCWGPNCLVGYHVSVIACRKEWSETRMVLACKLFSTILLPLNCFNYL